MFWKKINERTRTLIYSVFVLALTIGALVIGASYQTADASGDKAGATASRPTGQLFAVPAASYAADPASLGGIPDGPGTPTLCGSDGAPRNVTFTVSGITGTPTNIQVGMTFGAPVHTFVGDVTAVLIAPNGASQTLFGYTGSTTAGGCGDSSDLAGPYNFLDTAAAPPSGGWWQSATAAGAAVALTTGNYRSTAKGGAGATNPQPPTSIDPSFAGVANANGTWTLRLTDGGGGDTGAISAATLSITGATVVAADAPVDFNGDGKTDYAVVRNTGGGPSGQVTWFYNENGTGTPTKAFAWGLGTDFFLSEDFDGDGKDDITVWRPGAATVAAFYILNSNGFTARVEPFGQTGDDPTVVNDYNGDNKADVAVYRAGVAAGQQSTWFYRTTAGGPVTYVPWGQNGDFPAPGDYDGNGSADFVVQRNNGGGQARFFTRLSTGAQYSTVFGTPTDVIVPGDYDGDGKTDIATLRGVGGAIEWHVLSSLTGSITYYTFGLSASDFPVQGDYDGDGKTEPAIWRASATPGASTFWVLRSQTGTATAFPIGANGDYPPANFNSH